MNRFELSPEGQRQVAVDCVLYGDDPVAILAATDRHLADSLSDLAGVQVLLFDAHLFRIETMSGKTITLADLAAPPTCWCVLVAGSSVSQAGLSELAMWWADTAGTPAPQLQVMAGVPIERTACMVLRVILRHSLETTRRVSRTMVELHHQIVSLREHNEEAGAIIESLRSTQMAAASYHKIVCEPSDSFWSPELDGDVALFSFPLRVFGISQIDLHFRRCGCSVGWLIVTVIAMENEHVLGAWKVPYEEIDGWLPLTFGRTLSVQSHYLRLQIQWHNQVGSPPQLSLSDQRVQLRGRAALHGATDGDRIPAIRLYRGIAGQEQPAAYWSDSPASEDATSAEHPC